eukprot:PhF_6_TR31772/c0_g1_i1/m.46785/K01939/purA, ADSS; adenylosuccinate synthase
MSTPECFIIAGATLGDEGKGATVDFLCRQYTKPLVIRYNGGPQAAHHVITTTGEGHCFAQIGAGLLHGNVDCLLSSYMVVEPFSFLREVQMLRDVRKAPDPLPRVFFDSNCYVVTPYHKVKNRIEELSRGKGRHGSTGRGVGLAVIDAANGIGVTIGDFTNADTLKRKLSLHVVTYVKACQDIIATITDLTTNQKAQSELNSACSTVPVKKLLEEYTNFATLVPIVTDGPKWVQHRLHTYDAVIFEGAQGALLDPRHGTIPHVTKAPCDFGNALLFIKDVGFTLFKFVQPLALMRTYGHRHGAGPLVTAVEGWETIFPELHNKWTEWQQEFRVGYLDLVALQYGVRILEWRMPLFTEFLGTVLRPTQLVINHLDCVEQYLKKNTTFPISDSYTLPGSRTDQQGLYGPLLSESMNEILFPCADPAKLTDFMKIASPGELKHITSAQQIIDVITGKLQKEVFITATGPRAEDR